jgi:WD40 repeat protein
MIRPERWFPIPGRAVSAAWSPDGGAVAVGTEEHGLFVFPFDSEPVHLRSAPGETLAWTADGLVAADGKRTARIVGDRARGRRQGGRIAAGAALVRLSERGLEVLDPRKLDVLATWPVPDHAIDVAVAGDEAVVASGSKGVAVVRLTDGVTRWVLEGEPVRAVAVSPDGLRIVASGDRRGWEGPTTGPLERLPESGAPAHAGRWFTLGGTVLAVGRGPVAPALERIEAAAASADGGRLLFAGDAEVWIVDPERIPATIGPIGDVRHLTATGDWLAASDNRGGVTVWDRERRLVAALAPGRSMDGAPVAIDRDRVLVALGGIQVWSVRDGARVTTWFAEGLELPRNLRIRGERIVAVGHDRVLVLDRDGRRLGGAGPWSEDRWSNLGVQDADLSDDGSILVVAVQDSRSPSRVCDAVTGEVLAEWPHADSVVALSGNRFALGSWDAPEIRSWPGGERTPTERFERGQRLGDALLWCTTREIGVRDPIGPRWSSGFHDDVLSVAAVGERLFAGGRDGRLAERALDGGALVAVLPAGRGGKITALGFDPSGEWLIVGASQRVDLWRLRPRPERVGLVDATAWQPPDSAIEVHGLGTVDAVALSDGLVVCGNRPMRWPRLEPAIGTVAPEGLEERADRLSSDGRVLLSGGSWGDEVVVRSWGGEERMRAPGVEGRERWIALSADGRRVLVAGSDRQTTEATVYAVDGERMGVLQIDAEAQHLAFDPQGRVVGWITSGPSFRWDPVGGSLTRWRAASVDAAEAVAFGHDRAVLWGRGVSWLVDDAGTQVPLHGGWIRTAAAISDDGELVALADWSGEVDLFDARGRRVLTLGHTTEGGWWTEVDGVREHHVGHAATRGVWSER